MGKSEENGAENDMETNSMYSLGENGGPRPSRSEAVLERLTELLVSGALKPGDTFPSEAELARRFGVSKPIIREALRQLSVMGAIEIRQGKPSVVRQLDAKPLQFYLRLAMASLERGLAEAIEVRRAFEIHSAMLAAAQAREEDKARLREILDRMEASKNEEDGWVQADIDFHMAIAVMTGNTLLRFMCEAFKSMMDDTIRTVHKHWDMRNPDETVARHVRVADAISRNDPQAAAQAMNAHFDATIPITLAATTKSKGEV